MSKKKLSVLVAALVASNAFAATDEVVVTGSYSPVSSEQLSSYVTRIDREQLLALSSHSLVDALRQVPSIWVEEQGGPGGITAIALRGAESNHTLVLLDGVELNDPTNTRGGAFDLNNINIHSIKRIEITRGAQSAIYGSDALAGVIHIITLDPTETAQQQLSVSAGEDGYKTASLAASGKLDNLGYAVKIQSKDAGEPIKGSTADNKEALAKLDWQQDAHRLDLSYRYFDGKKTNYPEQSGGPLFAQSDELDHSKFTDQNAALGWQWQINDFWRSKLQGGWFKRTEDLTSPGIIPFDAVPPNGANTDFTRTDFSWINRLGSEKTVWANLGIETKEEDGTSKGYVDFGQIIPTDFSLKRRVNSAFANLNAQATPELLLQASIRRDEVQHSINKTTGQAGMRYQLNENLVWFINGGNGFKLPSFSALGHPLVGNPDLKPELSRTLDSGIEWNLDNQKISFAYFKNTYRDLIDFDNNLFKNVNRSKVNSEGAEVEWHWHSVDNQWQAGAHGSYADIDAENPLMGRPQVKAGANIGYQLSEHWGFRANYLWVGERFATSRYSGDGVTQTLDSYNRLDASAKWTFNEHVNISLSLENLTDENYMNDIGFPAVGRAGFITANFTL